MKLSKKEEQTYTREAVEVMTDRCLERESLNDDKVLKKEISKNLLLLKLKEN